MRIFLVYLSVVVWGATVFWMHPAVGLTLKVSIDWSPEPKNPPALEPVVEELDSHQRLRARRVGDAWVFDYTKGQQLLVPLTVGVTPALPDVYEFDPLLIQAPFFATALEVEITAAQVDVGAQTVTDLYATKIRKLSLSGLFTYYQRARVVALERMEQRGNLWAGLTDYDVQAVFTYLQASILLDERAFAAPDDDVVRARDWLVEAYSNKPARVDHAIGLENAKGLTEKLDDVEGLEHTRLWQAIVELDCGQRVPMLRAYREMYSGLTPERKERILKVTGVNLNTVQSAINECVRVNAQAVIRGQSVQGIPVPAQLDDAIKNSNALVKATYLGAHEKRALKSDVLYLRTLRERLP